MQSIVSSRLGLAEVGRNMLGEFSAGDKFSLYKGTKRYELTNHLGNVLSVVSDELTPNGEAQVLSAKDYYPFGMSMPSRTTEGGTYRYGFNGKETDQETGIQDYGMRWYLPNIARFPSVDPIRGAYPELTPYQFASNRPIDGIDLDGLEWVKQSSFNPNGSIRTKITGSNAVYRIVIGTTTHYASDFRIIGSDIYYKIGKHLYQKQFFGKLAGPLSEDSNFGHRITVDNLTGNQLTYNIEQLEQYPQSKMHINYFGTEVETVETANRYQNSGGMCFLSCLARYYKAIGKDIKSYSDMKASDVLLAASRKPNDPYLGWGAGSVLMAHKKGVLVTDEGVWKGELQEGALIQWWKNPLGGINKPTHEEVIAGIKNQIANPINSISGHSVIFKEYIIENDSIMGFIYYDASGTEHSIRKDKGTEATDKRFYGTNIKD